MVMATEPRINIGDYIQALAAAQFFDSIDTLIERERLDEYDGEKVKMIMNGWYMHHPEHWPPSPKIRPLFVAFHINSAVRSGLLTPPGASIISGNMRRSAAATSQRWRCCRRRVWRPGSRHV